MIVKLSTPDKPLEGRLRDGASWRTEVHVSRTLAEDYSTLAYRLIGKEMYSLETLLPNQS